ncbi:MAG TPA: ABC transporter permease, partial [Gemmatimonadaceae bacterium]|nr:ABC transporter permease [Gemmatimonadaceae bacterium]
METLIHDLRLAFRSLRKTPGFTLIAVLCLALGTGATTAIFSVVNAVLLRPLPYPQPEQLVRIYEASTVKAGFHGSVAPANFLDWRRENTVFAQLAEYNTVSVNLQSDAAPERLSATTASANLFSMLRVKPELGRTFLPNEDQPGAARVAVLSDALWRTRFGADRGIIGRTITLDDQQVTVVGVMPPDFSFPATSQIDLWVPRIFTADQASTRGSHYLAVVGRLKPGVTLDAARAQMKQIAARIAQQYPDDEGTRTVMLSSMHDDLFGSAIHRELFVLLGASALVLLIACVNVANLLLARAAARRREVAVRVALGAGRARLVRQFLTESIVLALGGGLLGLLVAHWGVRALVALASQDIPRAHPIGFDAGVFAFLLAIALVTGMAFGLAPALQGARVDPRDNLSEGGRGGSTGRVQQRFRNGLVAAEIALSLVLLVGAGLLMKAFLAIERTPSGLITDHVLTLHVALNGDKYNGAPGDRFYTPVLQRVRAIPGVTSAGIISLLPLQDYWTNGNFEIVGRPAPERGHEPFAELRVASPGYFSALRVPVEAGRDFTEQDVPGSLPVVIINQALAKQYFPNESPIGQRIRLDTTAFTIVGVVGDVRGFRLDFAPMPALFTSYRQTSEFMPNNMAFVVRTEVPPASVTSAIRGAVQSVDPGQPIFNVQTMDEVVANSLSDHRTYLWLLATFAGVALVLATAGIYGVTSYLVTQRTREMGIRLALGATPASLQRLVVRQGAVVAVIGTVIGLVAAFA